jgi:phytoene dehydrogenase-like protein
MTRSPAADACGAVASRACRDGSRPPCPGRFDGRQAGKQCPVPEPLDAIVVGSGPNGLTAAVTLARAGVHVRLYEAADELGGGTRSGELTLPGFRHDLCSAVHPLGAGSPAFSDLPLADHGLEWLQPQVALAHPQTDGSAAVLTRSVDETAASLGRDGSAWRALVEPFIGRWERLAPEILRPVTVAVPRHPLVSPLSARFGLRGMWPARLGAGRFREDRTKALLAGLAGHAIAPLRSPLTMGVALLFALAAHDVGWPVPRGGSQSIADALASYLRSLGGEIETGVTVTALDDLPHARAYLLDVMPRDLVAMSGSRLPARYRRRLRRYRSGPAVFKVDYALSGPVPWTAEACHGAGTVHLGASLAEIGSALSAACAGRAPSPPFLISAQPTVVDPSRAPDGHHILWVYAHVPHGWRGDLTEAIEDQIERFAPDFRDLVLGRRVWAPADLEARNRNLVGGDISGGAFRGRQVLFRPVVATVPYITPDPEVYLCSSATPPGPGVHGMCGYLAAQIALRQSFGRRHSDQL